MVRPEAGDHAVPPNPKEVLPETSGDGSYESSSSSTANTNSADFGTPDLDPAISSDQGGPVNATNVAISQAADPDNASPDPATALNTPASNDSDALQTGQSAADAASMLTDLPTDEGQDTDLSGVASDTVDALQTGQSGQAVESMLSNVQLDQATGSSADSSASTPAPGPPEAAGEPDGDQDRADTPQDAPEPPGEENFSLSLDAARGLVPDGSLDQEEGDEPFVSSYVPDDTAPGLEWAPAQEEVAPTGVVGQDEPGPGETGPGETGPDPSFSVEDGSGNEPDGSDGSDGGATESGGFGGGGEGDYGLEYSGGSSSAEPSAEPSAGPEPTAPDE
jgi:hypothetical protein